MAAMSSIPDREVKVNSESKAFDEKIKFSHIIRTPLGTRDIVGKDMSIRDKIFDIIKKSSKSRGAVQLETPVIELYSLVKNLYGDEFNKLVYKLSDGGGDDLILRYDLTVPLARYIATNGIKTFRRYQIGKVYRRDDPQITKGRFREFYQADFDIIGDDQGTCIYDAEILDLMVELLDKLIGCNTYTININHREIVYSIINKCNISTANLTYVVNMLDRLDKVTWSTIKNDFVVDEIITDESINKLDQIMSDIMKISLTTMDFGSVLKYLIDSEIIIGDVLDNMLKIQAMLIKLNIINNFVLNPFLARGLAYYTGIIYEATYNNKELMIGTIAAGGRYDKMIGKFTNNGDVCAVGLSIGVERIATIIDKSAFIADDPPQIYVASVGKSLIADRVMLTCQLRKLGFTVVMSHLADPKMRTQFDDVFERKIPFMIVIGNTEIATNTLTIKNVATREQIKCSREEGIALLKEKLKVK